LSSINPCGLRIQRDADISAVGRHLGDQLLRFRHRRIRMMRGNVPSIAPFSATCSPGNPATSR
jgi:hypothetical protein